MFRIFTESSVSQSGVVLAVHLLRTCLLQVLQCAGGAVPVGADGLLAADHAGRLLPRPPLRRDGEPKTSNIRMPSRRESRSLEAGESRSLEGCIGLQAVENGEAAATLARVLVLCVPCSQKRLVCSLTNGAPQLPSQGSDAANAIRAVPCRSGGGYTV